MYALFCIAIAGLGKSSSKGGRSTEEESVNGKINIIAGVQNIKNLSTN